MNIFKRSHVHSSNRKQSRSPSSFEIPKLCLTRQKRSASIDSIETALETLEIPALENILRSSSCDSIAKRIHETKSSPDLLHCPTQTSNIGHTDDVAVMSLLGSKRSNSFDNASQWYFVNSSDDNSSDKECSAGSSLTVPKGQMRRASWEIPKICLHCLHMETLAKEKQERMSAGPKFFLGDSANVDVLSPGSRSPCSSTSSVYDSDENECYLSDSENSDSQNLTVRFSDTTHGNMINPPVISILEKAKHRIRINNESLSDLNLIGVPCRSVIVDPNSPNSDQISYTDVVTLEVPVIKQRSTSLDASCMMGSPTKCSLEEELKVHPVKKQARSKSMDSNMPRKGSSTTAALLALIQQSFK